MRIEKVAIKKDFRKFRKSGFKPERVPEGVDCIAREMQVESITALKDAKYPMWQAPTGCGKSKAITAVASLQQKNHGIRHTIILTPQTIQGKSYNDNTMWVQGIGKVEWVVSPMDRLTSPTTSDLVKREQLIEFLRSGRKNLVCTYSTFILAYKSLSEAERFELLSDGFICVDECHHLAFSRNGQRAEFNELGRIVDEVIEKIPTCRVGMATATFCRGDLGAILKPETFAKFTNYDYAYDRYFAQMEHLESFEFKFIPYRRKRGKYQPAKIISDMFNEWNAKTIIYVPNVNSSCSHGKHHEVQKILEGLGKDKNGKFDYPEDENGVIQVARKNGKKLRVINLVEENGRDAKKAYIDDIRSNKDPVVRQENKDKLDVIIALGMFKEGADWEFAERSFIIGYRGSLVELVQITGRLFRDVPGKKHVQVVHLIEATLGTEKSEFHGDLNKMMIAVFGVMLMENIFDPIRLESERVIGKNGRKDGYVDFLDIAVPEDRRQDFLASIFQEVICRLKTCRDDDVVEKFRDDEFDNIVEKHLDAGGFNKDHLKEIADKVWRMVARNRLQILGVDIDNIDIKLIKMANPMLGLSYYLTDKLEDADLSMIKSAFHKRGTIYSFKEARKIVRCLKLQSYQDYRKAWMDGTIDQGLPGAPDILYKGRGWKGWPNFLNIRDRKVSKSYIEASEIANKLGIQNCQQYFSMRLSLPEGMPSRPDYVYQGLGWENWNVFLGTPKRKKDVVVKPVKPVKIVLGFEQARDMARKLKLNGHRSYREAHRRGLLSIGMPGNPEEVYVKSGWIGWPDFLGTGRRRQVRAWSYKKASRFVRSMGIKSSKEYNDCWRQGKLPLGIPKDLYRSYASLWKGWGDFLGVEEIGFLTYKEAKKEAMSLGITSMAQFDRAMKLGKFSQGMPKSPKYVYRKNKKGNSFNEFFGKECFEAIPFIRARKIVRRLHFPSHMDYRKAWRDGWLHKGLPSTPESVYRKCGWKGWKDFKGT